MIDALGNPLSCAWPQAVRAYDQAIDCQLHGWLGALPALDQALRHDPAFALAHAARALLLQAQGRGAEARQAIASALDRCTASTTDRERAHIALLALVVEGRPAAALTAVVDHAGRWPTDALALSTALGAFGLFAFSGRADHDQARLSFIRRIAPHHGDHSAWLLTQLSWAHTEAGQPDVGLELVERSLALRRANGNAAHVMAHARFERAEPLQALAFIDEWLTRYPFEGVLYGHLNWHAALAEIELGLIDAAVARLVDVILPHLQHALPLIGLTDAASLLWRLGLQGRNGLSWAATQAYAEARYPQGGNVFVELHLAMLAAAQRDAAALAQCRARLQRQADAGHAGAATAMLWVDGLQRLGGGDGVSAASARVAAQASAQAAAQAAAKAAFDACIAQAARLGGSHAQRTIIQHTRTAMFLPGANRQPSP